VGVGEYMQLLVEEPSQENYYESLEDLYFRAITAHFLLDSRFYEFIEERDISIKGLPAKRLIVSFASNEGVLYKKVVVGFLDTRYDKPPPDSVAFRIIYQAPTERFDDHYQDFRLVVDSFKFTD
jgi:hypothetical protein